jgi:superfamily II DNA or RNA helicase
LFATYALAKLGLDIPRLNVEILATPKRDKTSVQQAVGRVMRPFEGKKQPVVYDIWDSKVAACQKWARERAKVYLGLGCEIQGGPKVRGGRK